VGIGGVLARRAVIALGVVIGRGAVRLGGLLVMFGSLGM
jgi:hypothetical protein